MCWLTITLRTPHLSSYSRRWACPLADFRACLFFSSSTSNSNLRFRLLSTQNGGVLWNPFSNITLFWFFFFSSFFSLISPSFILKLYKYYHLLLLCKKSLGHSKTTWTRSLLARTIKRIYKPTKNWKILYRMSLSLQTICIIQCRWVSILGIRHHGRG